MTPATMRRLARLHAQLARTYREAAAEAANDNHEPDELTKVDVAKLLRERGYYDKEDPA